jgi:hypothetical protein
MVVAEVVMVVQQLEILELLVVEVQRDIPVMEVLEELQVMELLAPVVEVAAADQVQLVLVVVEELFLQENKHLGQVEVQFQE